MVNEGTMETISKTYHVTLDVTVEMTVNVPPEKVIKHIMDNPPYLQISSFGGNDGWFTIKSGEVCKVLSVYPTGGEP